MTRKITLDINDFCYYLIAFDYNSVKEYFTYDEMYSTIYDTPGGFIERFKDTQYALSQNITIEQCINLMENQLADHFIKINKFYVSTYAMQKLKLIEQDIIEDALRDMVLRPSEVNESYKAVLNESLQENIDEEELSDQIYEWLCERIDEEIITFNDLKTGKWVDKCDKAGFNILEDLDIVIGMSDWDDDYDRDEVEQSTDDDLKYFYSIVGKVINNMKPEPLNKIRTEAIDGVRTFIGFSKEYTDVNVKCDGWNKSCVKGDKLDEDVVVYWSLNSEWAFYYYVNESIDEKYHWWAAFSIDAVNNFSEKYLIDFPKFLVETATIPEFDECKTNLE